MEGFTFLEYLILVLVGLLFVRDELINWVKQKFGFSTENQNATKSQMTELSEYVNHRQTEILAEQTRILGNIHEDVKTVVRKHEEWDKYGVPQRPLK